MGIPFEPLRFHLKFSKVVNMTKKAKVITASVAVSILVLSLIISLTLYFVLDSDKFSYVARAQGLSQFTQRQRETVNNADYYVSTEGDDDNIGSITAPFKTIDKAQLTVREAIKSAKVSNEGLIVAIKGGEYNTSGLVFNNEDTIDGKRVRYTAYDNTPVIINGGVRLTSGDFNKVEGEAKSRLNSEIADKVYSINLSEYGITAESLGQLYSVGAFTTADKYDGDHVGANPTEVFFNDKRMDIARYPNKGETLDIKKVNDLGDCYEPKPQDYRPEWLNTRNPRGGTFTVDNKTNNRIKSWKNLDDVWVFGYFYWDWADMSSTIKNYDPNKGSITMEYCSKYGYQKGADYYFYNVLEELDAPGEYYIDRENLKLYLYPEGDISDAEVMLSLITDDIITVEESAKNITFEGLTLQCGRGSGVTVDGESIIITDSIIKNIAENGVKIRGKNNKLSNSEVTHIGKNAVWVGSEMLNGDGEDIRENGLMPENNIVDNNVLHDFGEVQRTYISGVSIHGVGNTASHNEIYNAPHMGIFYEGNDHMIEYNYLHDVVKDSTDAGAIYAGRNLSYYGNVIRYNCIDTIGGGEFAPDGIYFDDGLSGQTAYGNLLVNMPKAGILIGGGRDNAVFNNLIINAVTPIHYDDRLYEGYHNNGWYKAHVKDASSNHWKLFETAQRLNSNWGNKYPAIALTHNDITRVDDDNFLLNPNSSLLNNVILSKGGKIGYIADSVTRYADMKNNSIYDLMDIGFANYDKGNYNFADGFTIIGFETIPINLIGRY